jgi:hypothetical protein
MSRSLAVRIADRLRREIAARWPRRVDARLPGLFGAALRELGVCRGDRVLLAVDTATLFSALPAPRLGGLSARAACRALIGEAFALVGAEGQVCVAFDPAADPKRLSHRREVYAADALRPGGLAGALLERPGAACSEAPVLAVAAAGGDAAELTAGQIGAAPFAMGAGSPWEKMLQRPTRLIVARDEGAANPGLLLAAHLRHASYDRPSFFHRPFPFRLRGRDGRTVETAFHLHACPFQPHYGLAGYADYGRFMDYLDDTHEGLYAKAALGSIGLVACDWAAQYRACLSENDRDVYLEDARYW